MRVLAHKVRVFIFEEFLIHHIKVHFTILQLVDSLDQEQIFGFDQGRDPQFVFHFKYTVELY